MNQNVLILHFRAKHSKKSLFSTTFSTSEDFRWMMTLLAVLVVSAVWQKDQIRPELTLNWAAQPTISLARWKISKKLLSHLDSSCWLLTAGQWDKAFPIQRSFTCSSGPIMLKLKKQIINESFSVRNSNFSSSSGHIPVAELVQAEGSSLKSGTHVWNRLCRHEEKPLLWREPSQSKTFSLCGDCQNALVQNTLYNHVYHS